MPSRFIYRIIHINNLDFIVKSGKLVCPNHLGNDGNYKNIGNNSIIAQRSAKPLPINKERTFKDYIAFYFGVRSIMLYNIHTGYGEVEQIEQEEIIYLKSDIYNIQSAGLDFFFTDGHALQFPVTRFFSELDDIGSVNFKDAYARDFSAASEINNPGLKRRKQSEFHIHQELDWNLIDEVIVKTQNTAGRVTQVLRENNSSKSVRVDGAFYF